jgi:hypothetical protein
MARGTHLAPLIIYTDHRFWSMRMLLLGPLVTPPKISLCCAVTLAGISVFLQPLLSPLDQLVSIPFADPLYHASSHDL